MVRANKAVNAVKHIIIGYPSGLGLVPKMP